MKTAAHKLLFFLPLIKSLEAQFVPEAEARLQAWRAYGTFVSQQLTAGVPMVPGKDFIYVTPPNMAAVRGGTPCPDSVTNFDLFALADGLQTVSQPLLDTSGASYIDSLYTYLQSVDLKTATPTAAQLDKLQSLTNDLSAAQDKFDTESNNAYTKYLADARAQATHQAFGSWITQRDPLYTSLQRQVKTANTALQNFEQSLYGPQYQALSTQKDKITNQAGDELSPEPGYNMPVYGAGGTYNVRINPFQENQLTDGIIYKPQYSLQGGYEESCDAWINYTGSANTVYNWNMVNVNGHDWSSLGHSTSVTNKCIMPAGVRRPKFCLRGAANHTARVVGANYFFGLISANKAGSTDTTVFNSWTDKFSTAVSLKLTMKGIGVFNIGAGYWDVGNVRSTYPSILPAPYGKDTLNQKIRLQRLLVGSEVGLTITVNDSGMYKSIYQFIEDAKKSAGGGFGIFGFHFGGGGSSATHRNITDVTFNQQQEGGQVIIAPSPKGVPVMLGALGKAL
ncbi:Uncharacterized protein BP5553_06311 [Venustampulla echinocandica]|uniref:Uncharacterized protein n=1 Tax=Venustampulla echinocandica TaxID=2656787 RepID=A0A370TJL2_9HELO|nr:Uncharacterized protein BP5553_06311 [Venustampulla echinocandica]RDL35699.1 Uncharacterized protein BP5553_06311 [Venustampulla echinocandica]